MHDQRQATQAGDGSTTLPTENSPQPYRPNADHPYDNLKHCDIVMKGGITSGVVYPDAVYELAQHYRLHSVGGTSAGAIAAAGAAAAELGRSESGSFASFETLRQLPTFLGQKTADSDDTNLLAFFQPQPETAPLFDTALAFVGEDAGKAQRVLGSALRSFPLAALIGIVPALFMLFFTFAPKNWGLGLLELLLIFFWAIVGCALAVVLAFALRTFTALKANYFGFCTGMPSARSHWSTKWSAKVKRWWDKIVGRQERIDGEAKPTQPQALTEWLAEYLDTLAGITDHSKPLTFGDLRWGRGKRNPMDDENNRPDFKHDPAIGLRMITTNLTLGRPYSLPFDTGIFYFDPVEWSHFFPPQIIEWLVTHSAPSTSGQIIQNLAGNVLVPLPDPDDLPVVVATRMSLSFPILLCAVPMYVVDYSRDFNKSSVKGESSPNESLLKDEKTAGYAEGDNRDDNSRKRYFAERCWFSDGGIAINFPVHFFDRPLPRWPTFAINLSVPHPDHPLSEMKEEEKVWMPTNNTQGAIPGWTRLKEGTMHGPLLGFLSGIFYTASTWMDQTQLTAPGFRDRIVHIAMDDKEGGLNLNMDKCLIKVLAKRGGMAGQKIVNAYALEPTSDDQVITWDNHRWIRYRSTMTMMEELFDALDTGYFPPLSGYRSYADLIRRDAESLPKSYPLKPQAQADLAIYCTDSMIKLAKNWKAAQEKKGVKMGDETPNPKPEMQIRVRI